MMPDTPEAKEVEALLERAGVRAAADPQSAYSLLRKFFINCVANLLAIVGDCNCNGLLANHRPRMETLYDEMMDVLAEAHADGFAALPEDFRDVVFSGLATYGEHFPSTKLDFDAGRALEIDSLNGYVCQVARRDGSASPANERLVEEVRTLVARATPTPDYNLNKASAKLKYVASAGTAPLARHRGHFHIIHITTARLSPLRSTSQPTPFGTLPPTLRRAHLLDVNAAAPHAVAGARRDSRRSLAPRARASAASAASAARLAAVESAAGSARPVARGTRPPYSRGSTSTSP